MLLSVDDDPDRDNTDLVGDADDVANKLPDRIFKAFYTGHQVGLCSKCYDFVELPNSPVRESAARRP